MKSDIIHVSSNGDGVNDFRLHLKAETSMNAEMRRNLLSASTIRLY